MNTKTKRVMLLTFNPQVEVLETLDLFQGYPDPKDSLMRYMDIIYNASAKMYRYEIVHEETLFESAPLQGRFSYLPQHLIEVIDRKREPNPAVFDYTHLLDNWNVVRRVSSRDVDEVWVMSHPHSNLADAVMGGPQAFWLCWPPLSNTDDARRRFPIMGFDYSQDEGAMLEAFIHRAESTLFEVYKKHPPKLNMWSKFTAVDKTHPQMAGVGTAHRAPNSNFDGDWKNSAYVLSSADDWYNYPHLSGAVKTVNHTEWGYGSRIRHHQWWLEHLPKEVGKTDGVMNNWWHYIMTPDWVNTN